MAMTVTYNLGGVALPYAIFQWPKYRGVVARVVEIDCPAQNYKALKTLAKSLGGKGTYLEAKGPDKAGNNPGTATVKIQGVYILRVAKVNSQLCRVYAADKRVILGQRVGDMDFQVRYGDGYLNETEAGTYQAAVKKLVASVDHLRGNVAGDAYATFPAAMKLRDGDLLAGLTLPHALGSLLDDAAADLTVYNDSFFRFPGRKDIEQDKANLPNKDSYSWRQEPGWVSEENIILQRPRKVRCYYHERHCLQMKNDDGQTIPPGPPELKILLEQVYASDGQYFTLEELLVHWGYASNEIADSEIANVFWTDTFQGTNLYATFGSVEFGEVHKAIRDGWRRLWRIIYTDPKGHIGGWTDWAFGKMNTDGSVSPVAVECKWVDFMGSIAPEDQNAGKFIGSHSTKNHDDNAPFVVMWDGDVSNGVIRLVQTATPSGGVAIPGALVENLGVKRVVSIEDGEGNAYNLQNTQMIEREDVAKAKFVANFDIKIYACATRRMPNNEKRWHNEAVDTSYADADIAFIELPPSGELYCFRDYVESGNPSHFGQGDGLGPILNKQALKDDAERRTEAWKLMHTAANDGFGVAESVMLFRDREVTGAVSEIILESTLEGEGCALRSRMIVGNLADENQRQRVASQRLANRKVKERGLEAVGV